MTKAPLDLHDAMRVIPIGLIVSVLKRFASGSFPPLKDHVTLGCGLAANGSSTAVDPPTGSVSVVSARALVNRGRTVNKQASQYCE